MQNQPTKWIVITGCSTGLGRSLVGAMRRQGWGVVGSYCVATNINDPHSNAFYEALGFAACGSMEHNNLTLQIYEKKVT